MRLLKVRNTPCASTGKSKIGERAVIELLNSGFLGATRGQPLGFRLLSRSPLPRYGLRRRPPDGELDPPPIVVAFNISDRSRRAVPRSGCSRWWTSPNDRPLLASRATDSRLNSSVK